MLSHGVVASVQPTLAVFTTPDVVEGLLQSMIVMGVPVKTFWFPPRNPTRTSCAAADGTTERSSRAGKIARK